MIDFIGIPRDREKSLMNPTENRKGVNHKWHNKINQFNVKTAVTNSTGLQTSKNFTNKKVLTHLSDAKIVARKLEQTLTETAEAVEEAEVIVVRDNLSQSLAANAAHKTQFLSNREVIRLFFAETVLENNKANKHKLMS